MRTVTEGFATYMQSERDTLDDMDVCKQKRLILKVKAALSHMNRNHSDPEKVFRLFGITFEDVYQASECDAAIAANASALLVH